jgi:hypothetical protein
LQLTSLKRAQPITPGQETTDPGDVLRAPDEPRQLFIGSPGPHGVGGVALHDVSIGRPLGQVAGVVESLILLVVRREIVLDLGTLRLLGVYLAGKQGDEQEESDTERQSCQGWYSGCHAALRSEVQ